MPNANTANYPFLFSPPSLFPIFDWKHFSIVFLTGKITPWVLISYLNPCQVKFEKTDKTTDKDSFKSTIYCV
jgi:hypothetical protein